MYYEINVSKKDKNPPLGIKVRYSHYFATAPRSLLTLHDVIVLLKHFKEVFPEPEYKLMAKECMEEAKLLDVDELLKL